MAPRRSLGLLSGASSGWMSRRTLHRARYHTEARWKEAEKNGDSIEEPVVLINLGPQDLINTGPPKQHTPADMKSPTHIQ